ncbi:MAG: HD domain-containing protein [Oscillospiraceae bacterium]|nr:HD domain-containing protein [Oscillospiraceae bacterium]
MKITVSELKTNMEKYIELAQQQNISVTKDGVHVATIISADSDMTSAYESILDEAYSEISQKIYDAGSQYEQLYPAFSKVANMVGLHGGKELGHADRMQYYLGIIINALLKNDSYKKEVASWDTNLFLLSAQLHDVGEAAIADQHLKKTGDLTESEFEEIKNHADLGVKIVQQAKESLELGTLFQYAEIVAGSHHEKWDGSGYPSGLKADAIPLQGRVMALVDVYDALTTDRPHRKRKTHKEAVEIIKNGSGTHFDPGLVEAFLAFESDFEGLTGNT